MLTVGDLRVCLGHLGCRAMGVCCRYLMGQAHKAMHDAFVEAETLIDKGAGALATPSRAVQLRSGVAAILVRPPHALPWHLTLSTPSVRVSCSPFV